MLDAGRLDIAAIDLQLGELGFFSMIDWLLAQNELHYSDYEAWRYGQLKSLDEKLMLNPQGLQKILENCTLNCQALGLSSEDQVYWRWDEPQGLALIASKNPKHHRLLTQCWIRPQDVPQLDLFMDNSALIVENKLRESLAARSFELAAAELQQLIELNPRQQRLGAYQDLINYAQHMQNNPIIEPGNIEAELEGLEQEVQPLAKETLGALARDYLTFGWRRLSASLTDVPFEQRTPKLHQSYALMQVPDWPAVLQTLNVSSERYQHAALLERLAVTYEALRQQGEALMSWCLLIDRHDYYAATAMVKNGGIAINQLVDDFWEFDESWSISCFPSLVLAKNPGLIQLLDEFPEFTHPTSLAMIVLLQCWINEADEIAARQQLKNLNPVLLRLYIELTRPDDKRV